MATEANIFWTVDGQLINVLDGASLVYFGHFGSVGDGYKHVAVTCGMCNCFRWSRELYPAA